MKSIYIIMVITIALLFSACSDGDGLFETETKVVVTACEIYTTVHDGDILVKEDDNTTIKVVHDANGTKKVCTLIGAAHLIREGN